MYLVVGLGNPGAKYENTRHNVGFMYLDLLAREENTVINQERFHGTTAKIKWNNYELFLLKPQTFMNLSGKSIQEASHFFKIPLRNIILIFDDLDQSHSAVKSRFGGGHGGHNGVRDTIEKFGDDKFYRIKIGIGKPEHKSATSNWVLNKFTNEELLTLQEHSFPEVKKRLLSILKETSK